MITPEEGVIPVEALQVPLQGRSWREQQWERLQACGVKGRLNVWPLRAGVQGSRLGWSEPGAGTFGLYSRLAEDLELYPECGEPSRV